jgi:hypothetical protein
MVYKAARGARITDDQAQRYGERIEALAEGGDGSVTSVVVYEDAKKKRSPLHEYFQWDDAVAAEAYRLNQAEYLLRSIYVIVTKEDGAEDEVRAFHNVVIERPEEQPERTYAPLARVLSEEELRRQVLAKAMHEFEQWRKRYQQYKELAPLFKVYEKVSKAVTA